MNARATSIRIFLADGTPDGIRIIDKSNWVGRAVVASRAQVGEALQREELSHPGVYLLLGAGDGSTPRLYIGEADVLRDRLRQHGSGKDFWTRFVAFTSTDESLNKGIIRYLESRLLQLARKANQWELDNGNVPGMPPLSEPDRADAEWFLDEMLVIFPLLGVDAFESASDEAEASSAVRELRISQRGAEGRGREVKDGFVVLKGSLARVKETPSIHVYIKDLRAQLVERGVLLQQGEHLVFQQDFRFSSPSTAAGVLVGGAANGRIAWQDEDGATLKHLQDARTEAAG